MKTREQLAWLYRRAGFGVAEGQLDALERAGLTNALDALVDPSAAGAALAPDPWAKVDLSAFDPDLRPNERQQLIVQTIGSWLVAMVETPRPFEEWMRWFWHGHFVSTLRGVKFPQLMVQQLRTIGELGLGDFRTLLRAMAVDPAMLVYLDGITNRKTAINENFGREVLELFALGIGNYTEDDVRAGAVAFSGWTVDRKGDLSRPTATFVAKRHDDTPQRYLGRNGVHDVDSAVDAIVDHPACAPFITGELARALLGPDVDDGLVRRLARDFAASGLQVRPLVRSILEAGLDGAGSGLVVTPVPWLVGMIKATGAPAWEVVAEVGPAGLVTAGQVPMDAPNVSGWPMGSAWFGASSTVARFNMASVVALKTPGAAAARVAASRGDVDGLADVLGRPGGFSDATRQAIASVREEDVKGQLALELAMASPDAVIA